jgi:hypothetical protein
MPALPSSQKGTETVEFAISAFLIFTLLFGIIEFSLLLFDKATIANASREGARVGILYRDYWDADGNALDRDAGLVQAQEDTLIKQAAMSYAQNFLISPGGGANLTEDDITITRNLGGDGEYNVGDSISVRIDYDFHFLLLPGLVAGLVSDGLPAQTVMFAE